MDLKIHFANSDEKLSHFEKLCEGYSQFQKNSITRIDLINLFKKARKEHIEEFNKSKEAIRELQRNSLHSPQNMMVTCSYCKKIKNERGEWKKAIEIGEDLSQIELSHGICPNCFKTEMDS